MIAPLDVPRVILTQGVEDDMGTRATIEDITQDMQLVDGQTLDDITDGNDEIVGSPRRDDGIDDDGYIGSLVLVVSTFVQQFLDDIREFLGQVLTNLRTCVFA